MTSHLCSNYFRGCLSLFQPDAEEIYPSKPTWIWSILTWVLHHCRFSMRHTLQRCPLFLRLLSTPFGMWFKALQSSATCGTAHRFWARVGSVPAGPLLSLKMSRKQCRYTSTSFGLTLEMIACDLPWRHQVQVQSHHSLAKWSSYGIC